MIKIEQEAWQLMVEHAYDLRDRDRVLFIDAAARQGEPVQWQRIEASAGGPAISSHGQGSA